MQDLAVALRVLNCRNTNGVSFPEAFRVALLTDLYTAVLKSHPNVNTAALLWFQSAVNKELDDTSCDDSGMRFWAPLPFHFAWFQRISIILMFTVFVFLCPCSLFSGPLSHSCVLCAGNPRGLPGSFGEVAFVPDWFLNVSRLGVAEEVRACVCVCVRARA